MTESGDDCCIVSLYQPTCFWMVIRSSQRCYTTFGIYGLKELRCKMWGIVDYYYCLNTETQYQWSTSIAAPAVVVGRVVSIFFGNFEYRSVITSMNWLSEFVPGNGPSMSTAPYCSGPGSRNRGSFRCLLLVQRFCAYERQSLTVA